MGFWEKIEEAAYSVVEDVGPEMVEFMQELISVPVGIPRGSPEKRQPGLFASRSGHSYNTQGVPGVPVIAGRSRREYWRPTSISQLPRFHDTFLDPLVRSNPGEPPRMETGRLYRSVNQNVFSAPGQGLFSTIITSEAPYKFELEYRLDRPYISTTFNAFVPQLPDRLLAAIRARF